MAFVSLASWADDIDVSKLRVQNVEYGAGGQLRWVQGCPDPYAENTDFTIDWTTFYTDEACTTIAKDETGNPYTLATLPVEKYYLKVTGAGNYSGMDYVTSFNVLKVEVKITFQNQEITFGDAEPQNYAYTLTKGANDFANTNNILQLTVGREPGTDAGVYAFTCSSTNPNFNLLRTDVGNAEAKFTINKLAINATATISGATQQAPGNIFTYDATEHKPTYVVTWTPQGATAPVPLEEGTDFAISYGTQVVNNEDVEILPINAATYNPTIKSIGNYAITLTNDQGQFPAFRINPATLSLSVIPQTKVYNGQAYDVEKAKFNIAGLVGNQTASGLVAVAPQEFSANVGEYQMGVNTRNIAFKDTEGKVVPNTNYDYTQVVPAIWAITKRPLNITVSPATMTKGTELSLAAIYPNYGASLIQTETTKEIEEAEYVQGNNLPQNDRGALLVDMNTLTQNIAKRLANNPATQNPAKPAEILNGVTTANIEVKTYPGAIKAEAQNDAAVANYNITFTDGDLTVTGAGYNIMPVVQNQIEYGDPVEITYNAYTYSGGQFGAATVNADKLQYIVKDAEGNVVENPTEIGTYTVTIDETTIEGTNDFATSVATALPTSFAIVKKKLNPTVNTYTVHAGDPKDLYKTTATVTYPAAVAQIAKDFALTFTPSDGAFVLDNQNPNLIANVNAGATLDVDLSEENAEDVLKHYDIGDVTLGAINFSNVYNLVIGGENTLTAIEAAEANGSEEVTVTFADGAINMQAAGEWYPCVLPFETSPAELVQVLGTYVVVNRLSDKSTASNIAFTLEMNEIPAGEAFVIKLAEPRNWSEFDTYATVAEYNAAKGTNLSADAFAALTDAEKIKDPANPYKYKFTNKTISKEIKAEAKGGNKFVGVYAKTSVQSSDAQKKSWLGNSSLKKADGTPRENIWYEPYSTAKEIAPFEAYLEYAPSASAPVITFEDIDGTVTAIKTVSGVESRELNAEGWYTLGGMKLNGAPSQKGVYINNGKKVVIK